MGLVGFFGSAVVSPTAITPANATVVEFEPLLKAVVTMTIIIVIIDTKIGLVSPFFGIVALDGKTRVIGRGGGGIVDVVLMMMMFFILMSVGSLLLFMLRQKIA